MLLLLIWWVASLSFALGWVLRTVTAARAGTADVHHPAHRSFRPVNRG